MYQGPATIAKERNASHQLRQNRRRNHKNGTHKASGTRPLASIANPKQTPIRTKRHRLSCSFGPLRIRGSAKSTAKENQTAKGRSVEHSPLKVIQPAEVASNAVEMVAASRSNSCRSKKNAVTRNARLSSATGRRAARSGFKPLPVPAATIQYSKGGFSNQGEPQSLGVIRSPFSAMARPIAAYLGSSGPSRPTPSRWNRYKPEMAAARISSRAFRRRKYKPLQNICKKIVRFQVQEQVVPRMATNGI
jgi:hypothetical protein